MSAAAEAMPQLEAMHTIECWAQNVQARTLLGRPGASRLKCTVELADGRKVVAVFTAEIEEAK